MTLILGNKTRWTIPAGFVVSGRLLPEIPGVDGPSESLWIRWLVDFFCIGNRIEDMTHTNKKGFTLIELLIVIGILAILATAVILILNPAELFRQARDSQRISDMATLKSALAFYLSTVATPDLDASGVCGTNYWGTVTGATENFTGTPAQHSNIGIAVDGTGWIPVNFTLIPGSSPLSSLPSDPLNPDTATQSYTYQCNASNLTFEINANLESARYKNTGPDDVESTDGGNNPDVYEVGNASGLSL